MATEKKVLDVSKWNTITNFDAVTKEVDGVIIRAGYRGYSSAGKLVTDPKFVQYITEFYKRGVPVGVYFLTTAITVKEAQNEADYVISLIKKAGVKVSFPIFVDTEYSNKEHNGRSDKLTKAVRTNCVAAFCERIKALGYEPGIYASDSWFTSKLIPAQIKSYKKWNARYSSTKPTLCTDNMISWQYTSNGTVSGIAGRVDLSHWYEDFTNSNNTTETIKKEETNVSNSNETTYKVKSGDTLSKIGTKLGVNWKDIASLNNIKSPYTIKVGQTLKIPSTSNSTTEAKPTTTTTPAKETEVKMIKPVHYMQRDSKWKSLSYAVDGERSTIGSAGCGPTAMAMVLASLVNPYIDPITTASWARMKGYKVKASGTAYSYFVPQGKQYGINITSICAGNIYHKPTNSAHNTALAELKKGNWLIACMGPGVWTSGGHYILVYGYKDGKVYINDSASTKENRACNTWDTFKNEVKYYWSVEVPESIKKSGKIVSVGKLNQNDFVREVQFCCGAGLDGDAGNQTLSKTITVSKSVNRTHPVVLVLQKKLKDLGYYTGKLDCSAGPLFDTATKNMQAKELNYSKKNQDGEFTAKGKSWKFVLGMLK